MVEHRYSTSSCVRRAGRVVAFLCAWNVYTFHASSMASAATLSLQSSTGTASQPVSLPLSLSGTSGTSTSAVDFVISYNYSDFLSVTAVAGASASQAGKSLSCYSTVGALRCVAYGLNTKQMTDGALATITAVPSTAGRTALLGVAGSASSLNGSAVPVSTQNGSVSTAGGVSGVCVDAKVLCVDDTPGATQEFSTIQAAANVAVAGSQILVYPGSYAPFRITRSGTPTAPIVFKANGRATITSASGDAISIAKASYITIDGFTLVGPKGRCLTADGASITAPAKGLTVLNLVCSGANAGGFRFVSVTESVVEGNKITGIVRSHGITLQNGSSDNVTFRRNTISDLADPSASGFFLKGNTAAGGDGIITHAVLDGNVIYNIPVHAINLDGVQNSTLTNNVAYKMNGSAVHAFGLESAAGPSNLRIINNSFHTPASGSWVVHTTEDAGAHTLFNNILLSDSVIAPGVSLGTTISLKSDYNVLTARDLVAQIGRGLDSKSFAATPAQIFTAPGSDYRLRTGSFAIDRGTASLGAISAPDVDCANNPRPNGTKHDIGAYESGSPATSMPYLLLSAPVADATVSGTATSIKAAVTGTWTPLAVEFYVDGVKVAEDTTSPFSIVWNTKTVTDATHIISAFARDAAGLVLAADTVKIAVNNAAATPTPTTLTVVSNVHPAVTGQTVMFTAALNPLTATGTVQFRDGSTVIGSGNVSAGRATFATTKLTAGTHAITASYAGGSVFASSTSSVLPQIVNNAASDSCADRAILCVDAQPGATQEYTTIQSAANAALAGDTVLVYPGTYAGFRIATSGVSNARLTFKGNGAPGSIVIASAATTGDGIRLDNVSHVTVENFSIAGMAESCIAIRGGSPTSPMTGLMVRNNTCTGARGSAGIYASQVSGSEITGNTINGLTTPGTHGIYLANAGSDNSILRGNTIYNITGADAAGIHMNGDFSIGGDGLISGVTIDSNMIYNINFNGISMDGVQNTSLINNLIVGVARAAVRAFKIDGAAGPKALRFINNSFHATGGWAIKISEDGGGHQVFNNVLLSDSSSAGSICIGVTTGFAGANNAVVNRFSRNEESTVVSLASWQASGLDTASFASTAEALFANPSLGDYRLRAGSTAVDKGLASFNGISAPVIDRSGTARPRGAAFDIGAFEQ